jgi:hypothetical protein
MKLFYRHKELSALNIKPGLIILLLFTGNLSYSQNGQSELSAASEKSYSEELFVKTDRDLYIAGEQVWMKVFKLSGLTHAPSNMSKVVYVELLDTENNPVQQLKIGIDGNSGSASFRLPDTLRTGNYILRSYTNWMKNFSKELFSYRMISVINPFKSISTIKFPSKSNIPDSVVFYPEGGHLIKGIETRLGFRSSDKYGQPVRIKAALVYNNNDTICNVNSDNNGYGWATITPSGQTGISLVTTDNKIPARRFLLPEVENSGMTLSLANKSENSPASVKIRMSPDIKSGGKKYFIKVLSTNLTSVEKEIKIDSANEIIIPEKDLPKDLSLISILDEKKKRLADRWIYNRTEQQVKYDINILNNTTGSRDELKIDITATDSDGRPVESDISITVAKAFTLNKNSFNRPGYRQIPGLATITADLASPDINDYLLFYSSPDFNLDSEMGSNNAFPVYLPELEGLLISGNIRDRKSGAPLKNENITLSFIGKVALCQFTKTNEQGDFYFATREHGLREIVIQPLSDKIKDYYVDIDVPFIPTFNKYNHGFFYIDSSKLGEINNAIISMQIKNIYDPFLQHTVIEPDYMETPNFYGIPDNTIQMSKYIELTSLKEVVKEIMPGVSTVRKNGEINFKLIYKYQSEPFENMPLVLVDGIPITDLEKVLDISSRELEKIDVLTTRYYISDIVLDGILHFVTKKGNLGVIDFDRSVFRIEAELLQNRKKFYSPEYPSDSLKNNRIPDFRNTLYWNPDLRSDKAGKGRVSFFTSDEPGEYIINVEGITPDGKTGFSSVPLTIKNR